jgi:hypothetical protein
MDRTSTRAPARRLRSGGVGLTLALIVGAALTATIGLAPGAQAATVTTNLTMDCTSSIVNASGSEQLTTSITPDPPVAGQAVDITIIPGPPVLQDTVNLNKVVITSPIPTQIAPGTVTVTFADASTPANLTGSYTISGSNLLLTFTGAGVPSNTAVLPKVIVHGTVTAGTAGQTMALQTPPTVTANASSGIFTLDATCAPAAGSPANLNSWVIAAPPAVPGAPNWPSASPGNGSAKVSWWAPSGNGSPLTGSVITPYINGVAQAPQTFNTPASTQTVTGLANGTTYTFKIAAKSAAGTGPQSVATNATLVGAPSIPQWVYAQPGNGAATVYWNAPVANASPIDGYLVTPYLNGTAQAVRTFNSTATSQVITGLTNGSSYTFTVAARNATGASPLSTPTNAVKPGTPTAPAFVTPRSGNGLVQLNWFLPANNGSAVTSYVVTPYKAGVAQPTTTFTGNPSGVTVTGLTNGATYSFQVVAYNAVGGSPLLGRSIDVVVGTPWSPTAITATAGTKQATVSWTAGGANSTPATTGYAVTPIINGWTQPVRTFASTATSQVITGLPTGASVTFRVAAINANGVGVLSGPSTAVTIT